MVKSVRCGKRQHTGGMSEWPKEPVLKTGMEQSIVGSNPTPSANFLVELLRPVSRYGRIRALHHLSGEVPEWSNGAAC